ncbi:hypothetical protein VMCG_05754 [Cytospora schulzeri]|uniref:Uncharacterized protein n=1 Tax=Cytospora schulzeri TaxID=448051 RepID=A0A423WI83_9PEZI|nr:hypothetical protein VMCG_05754 [Valsa malicola]
MGANVTLSEKHICGTKRHQRMCNECKYERGDYRCHTASNYGTSEVPIIKSRRRNFHTDFERYFPGLFPELFPPSEQRYRSVLPHVPYNTTSTTWMLSMVRCRDCGVFKELAGLCYGSVFTDSRPSRHPSWHHRGHIGDSFHPGTESRLCPPCFSKRYGTEALQQSLVDFALKSAQADLTQAIYFLKFGWLRLNYCDEWLRGKDCISLRDKIATQALRLQNDNEPGDGKGAHPREPDMETLHALYHETYHFIYHVVAEDSRKTYLRRDRLRDWLDDYEKGERAYWSFKEIIRRINESPGLLVDYAMLPAAL